jgi:hypothetical protein
MEPLRLRRTATEGLRVNTQTPRRLPPLRPEYRARLISVPGHRPGAARSQQHPVSAAYWACPAGRYGALAASDSGCSATWSCSLWLSRSGARPSSRPCGWRPLVRRPSTCVPRRRISGPGHPGSARRTSRGGPGEGAQRMWPAMRPPRRGCLDAPGQPSQPRRYRAHGARTAPHRPATYPGGPAPLTMAITHASSAAEGHRDTPGITGCRRFLTAKSRSNDLEPGYLDSVTGL